MTMLWSTTACTHTHTHTQGYLTPSAREESTINTWWIALAKTLLTLVLFKSMCRIFNLDVPTKSD